MNHLPRAEQQDEKLSPDIEAILREGLLAAPDNFDELILNKLIVQELSESVAQKISLRSKIIALCRSAIFIMSGALAAAEVVAFVFTFWTTSNAL